MSWLSSQLFSLVQRAPFYEALHREAVDLLPRGDASGSARVWLDVGTGPGLLARLAAARGYQVQGLDFDPAMVRRAQAIAGIGDEDADASKSLHGPVRFAQGSVFDLARHGWQADVVSAASLLAELPQRQAALQGLLAAVRPGGAALLVEPSEHLTPANARAWLTRQSGTSMAWVLRLWAHTRQPGRVVTAADLAIPGWNLFLHPLLDGMVNAWLLRSIEA